MPRTLDIRIAVAVDSDLDWDCRPVRHSDVDAFENMTWCGSLNDNTTRTVVTCTVNAPDEVPTINGDICATGPEVAAKIRALARIFPAIRTNLSPTHYRVLQDVIALIPETSDVA